MKKNWLLLGFFLMLGNLLPGQEKTNFNSNHRMPKLVVGIVVDQMRYDFLYRYYDRLSDGGFKRLITNGVNCTNTQFNYIPTVTAAGHASIYSGCPPAINGIAGNNWYDKFLRRSVYCTEDSTVIGVGLEGNDGKMSPMNLKVTTIGDQVRLATNFRGKSIGIALKDRGAILPAGHSPNAAYWMNVNTGGFGTSSYYMNDLPEWVKDYNNQKNADKYMREGWNTLYPIDTYIQSDADNREYENALKGESSPVFPHKLLPGKNDRYGILKTSPYGNTMTADFAIAAIRGEQLGMDDETDMLAISFSSTDYVGHSFGPNSIESEDTYLRLDRDIERILNMLDQQVGKGNYLLFLTADHGVCDVPGHSQLHKMPGSVLTNKQFKDGLKTAIEAKYGKFPFILDNANYQLYVDKALLKEKGISYADFFEFIRGYLMRLDGVANVIDHSGLADQIMPEFFRSKIENGINPKRSGDITIVMQPGWQASYARGTGHGSIYEYDSHVPGIFYGWKLKHREVVERVYITDIAATICTLLHIQPPTGSIGNPVIQVINAGE